MAWFMFIVSVKLKNKAMEKHAKQDLVTLEKHYSLSILLFAVYVILFLGS